MNDDNIIQLDTIRIERHKPRQCICDPYNKKFTVDTINKEVTCACGMVVDPFEAIEYLASHYDQINERHKALSDQRKQWLKEKPHSVLFKDMERHYSRGTMLPHCPKCKELFDFKDVTFWGNAEFYRKLEKKKLEQSLF
jgi:hypothetical protein